MGGAGIGAHHDNDVAVHDRIEGLCPGRLTQRGFQAVTGRGMANPCAGIDIVRTECGAHQLLNQVGFFIRAARRSNTTHRITTILPLNAFDFTRGVVNGFVPADLLPGVGNFLANHGLEHAIFVRGVTPGKTAFHARMAAIGFAVFPGHHTHDFFAFHVGFKAATHTAVGASGNNRVFRLAHHDDGFLG